MRQVNEIWKDDKTWKVQCPNGILTFKTKRRANEVAEANKAKEKINQRLEHFGLRFS